MIRLCSGAPERIVELGLCGSAAGPAEHAMALLTRLLADERYRIERRIELLAWVPLIHTPALTFGHNPPRPDEAFHAVPPVRHNQKIDSLSVFDTRKVAHP